MDSDVISYKQLQKPGGKGMWPLAVINKQCGEVKVLIFRYLIIHKPITYEI